MILEEYVKTNSVKKICTKYQIVKDTLRKWRSQNSVIATSQTGTIYTAWQLYQMKRKHESLQMDNKIVHLCRCTASAPIREKVEEVNRLQKLFSVHALCHVLDLSRATYYRVSLGKKKQNQI